MGLAQKVDAWREKNHESPQFCRNTGNFLKGRRQALSLSQAQLQGLGSQEAHERAGDKRLEREPV